MVKVGQALRDEGKRIGLTKGHAKGRANPLLRLLERRFGEVPEEMVAQVRAADVEQLDGWLDAVLNADSLADVFRSGAAPLGDARHNIAHLDTARGRWASLSTRQTEAALTHFVSLAPPGSRLWLEEAMANVGQSMRDEGERVGLAKGHAEGLADSLIRLLERRFGEMPEEVVAQVCAADVEQLDGWLDAVLDADSFAGVFRNGVAPPDARHDPARRDTGRARLAETAPEGGRHWWNESMNTLGQALRDEGEAIGLTKGERIGLKKGEAIGRADTLLRLLERRFGGVPEEMVAQIRAADTERLDGWLDAILDASSLDDIFQGNIAH